jgi:multiple sugar transport system permease protein
MERARCVNPPGAERERRVPRRGFDLGLDRPSRQGWFAYLLLLPAALLIVAFIVYPLFVSFDLSFQNVNMARIGDPRRPFTTANYARLFFSAEFWESAWVTFKLIVVVTVCCFGIGIGTALLLNNRFRGRRLARLLVALPWAVPEVVAVVIFAWLFDSSFGLVSWLLVKIGLTSEMMAWFSDPSAAFIAVSITMIWKAYPFVSTMALAGLQSIPDDLYGAARVDGATAWQQFRHVTLPSLMPVIAITAVLLVLWLFRDFSIVYVMTQGGPVRATQTLSIMTYQQAFGFFRMGYASAVGVVTLILCLLAGLLLVGRRTDAIY